MLLVKCEGVRGFVKKEVRSGQPFRYGPGFFGDMGRVCVGYAEHQRWSSRSTGLAIAKDEYAGTGRVRHSEALIEIALAIVKRMKWKIVQQSVRHNDNVIALNVPADRSDELIVELLQMGPGCAQELPGEALGVLRP